MRARLQWLDDVRPDGPEIQTIIGEIARRRIPVDPTLIAYTTKFEGRAPRFVASPDLRLAPQPMRSSFTTLSFVRDWSREDFRSRPTGVAEDGGARTRLSSRRRPPHRRIR